MATRRKRFVVADGDRRGRRQLRRPATEFGTRQADLRAAMEQQLA